jgi:hypothetical protein
VPIASAQLTWLASALALTKPVTAFIEPAAALILATRALPW